MRAVCLSGWVAFAGLMVVAPGTAQALSCDTNGVNPYPLGQENVPTNTLLWGYPAAVTRLLGPEGEAIPTKERALVIGGSSGRRWTVPVLVPGSVLQPNARYTIERDDPLAIHEFVTADGPARATPELPTLVFTEPHVGAFWGSLMPARWTSLQFEGIGSEGLLLIGLGDGAPSDELTSLATLEDLLIDGPPSAEAIAQAPLVQWISDSGDLDVGISDCAFWPEGAPDTLTGRFGALDLAGNFSGWVDVPLELPSAAEAQAVADERAEIEARADAEAARVRAENLARLDAASQSSGCALHPGHSQAAGAIVALALVSIGRARRKQRKPAR